MVSHPHRLDRMGNALTPCAGGQDILEQRCGLLHLRPDLLRAQLAIDITMVSPLRRNGLVGDSQSLWERRYPELSGQFGEIPSCCLRVRSWRTVVIRKLWTSCDTWPSQSSSGTFPSATKSGGCVVDAMARHHGLQRCQILRSVSPRITDVSSDGGIPTTPQEDDE